MEVEQLKNELREFRQKQSGFSLMMQKRQTKFFFELKMEIEELKNELGEKQKKKKTNQENDKAKAML